MIELMRLSDDLVVENGIGDCSMLEETDEDADDFPTNTSLLEILRECIEDCELTARELKAMKMRLGLDGYTPMSRDEVARAMDASTARIRQIEAKLIRHSPLGCHRPRKKLPDYFD